MQKIIIDGKHVNNINQLHDILKKELNLPDYYGKNFDALWDCLTGWVTLPLIIEWKNFQKSKNNLGGEVEKILHILLKAEQELPGLKIEIA